ncbi:MAG TPA: glycosyltransferase family 39 protein [Tepidisphaeraceae bacterium]|nr:glycosyltransferase family 39 protein [Tepidisphaeraceae bacterium]
MGIASQQRLIGWPGSPVYSQRATRMNRRGGHCLALSLIIVFGAVLRFTWLNYPPVWGDEVRTFGRTMGTFADLCKVLQDAGFTPLHYELYWWLHNHFILTPTMLRLIPAIAGTLTIPAMYFLARLLTNKRIALGAALFTACSAWLLNYSRDAKMYSEFWLFCTLNYACLIWWFRNKRPIAWWCFVTSGVAMVGLDGLGFLVIGVGVVWYLTQRRVHWLSSLAYLLALAIIAAGPLGYYYYFSDWHRHTLEWIEYYYSDQTGPEMVINLASALLFKYQFRSEAFRYYGIQNAFGIKLAAVAMALVAAIIFVGALPWRAANRSTRVLAGGGDEVSPEPWWRMLLWLLSAVVLPVYLWYCISVEHFVTPLEWANRIGNLMHGLWPWVIITATVIAAVCMAARELAATFAMFLLILLSGIFGAAFAQGGWSDVSAILDATASLLSKPWMLVMGVGIGAGLLWYYCAPRGFIRGRSIAGFLAVAAAIDILSAAAVALILLCVHALVVGQSFWPADLLHQWQSLLLHPLILLFAVALPTFLAAMHGSVDLRWRLRRWLVFFAVVGAIIFLCQAIAMAVGHPIQSLWVPRYLGVIWPPMCIGFIVLIFRLPSRGLRIGSLIAVIGLNLFSFGARVLGDTEPPIDRVVTDISAQELHPDRIHTLVYMPNGEWGPGGGSMTNLVGRYYLMVNRLQRGLPTMTPQDFEEIGWVDQGKFEDSLSPDAIHQLLADHPHLHRLVVWTTEDLSTASEKVDAISTSLGKSWKLVSDQRWTARDEWSWTSLFICHRREYQQR